MDEPVDGLTIDVRANTQDFARDIAAMRTSFDGTLVSGFARAGTVLESGLTGAIKRGGLGFDDLKRVALNTVNDIAAQAVQGLVGSASGGAGGSGSVTGVAGLLGSLLGLPGRATGGPVSPGQSYVVGERGPELFRPAAVGAIAPAQSGAGGAAVGNSPREVRVSINVVSPQGSTASQSLQRSSRQVASAVRRALTNY